MAINDYRVNYYPTHWQSIIPPGRHWCPCGCERFWDSNNVTYTYGTTTVIPNAPKRRDVIDSDYEKQLKDAGIIE